MITEPDDKPPYSHKTPMHAYQTDGLHITLDKEGSHRFSKVSYPVRYGRYSEIETPEYLFQLNLNGEIKFIQGRGQTWPDRLEWLKRTVADDWVYYSTGGYSGVFDAFGEYYLPCLSYPSNSITVRNPFEDPAVRTAIDSWWDLQARLKQQIPRVSPQPLRQFLTVVCAHDAVYLAKRALELHHVIGGNVSVLPPDSRHVDYEVIPVNVADGCLYHCAFCRVKSGRSFTPRTKRNIMEQVRNLKAFYGRDIRNYNAVFLGQHDALNAEPEHLEFAAHYCYEKFGFDHSHVQGASLFLFGSVDSLIRASDTLFDRLQELPFSTYINIGFESADPETLAMIKKPLTPELVDTAFSRMLEVNRRYDRIEITGNFLFADRLPPGHLDAFLELTRKRVPHPYSKGTIYFSPFGGDSERQQRGMLRKFYKIKALSPLPTYLYLIQRL